MFKLYNKETKKEIADLEGDNLYITINEYNEVSVYEIYEGRLHYDCYMVKNDVTDQYKIVYQNVLQ